MYKCGMWKPDTNNQTLTRGVPTIGDTRKKYNIQSVIRMLMRRNCEVEKVTRFLKEVGIFDEI